MVANKVCDDQAVWRSLDSKALYHATVFASELYEDVLDDDLAACLPVGFSLSATFQTKATLSSKPFGVLTVVDGGRSFDSEG